MAEGIYYRIELVLVDNAYTKSAEYYDLIYLSRAKEMYESSFSQFLEFAKTFSGLDLTSYVDFGCGTGTHMLIGVDKGFEILGVDISSHQLKVAKNKFLGNPKVSFLQADLAKLPIPQKQFSAGVSFFGSASYLLEDKHFVDFLNSAYEYILPGGILFFEVWNITAIRSDSKHFLEVENEKYRLLRYHTTQLDYENSIIGFDMKHIIFENDQVIDEFIERHRLRGFSVTELKHLIGHTKWELVKIYSQNNDYELVDPDPEFLRFQVLLKRSN